MSVVVPARNSAAQLPALLASLDAQSFPREGFEIVVVDNGSRDGTAAVAARAGAIVLTEPRPSRARARNLGVEAANGNLIAFIDADCIAEPDWLESLVGCLSRSPLAAGPVRVTTSAAASRLERLDALWRFRELERNVKDEGWAVTANLGIRRDAFEAVDGFDASFAHIGEDFDLCVRCAAAGSGLAWCEEAVVVHPAEASLRALLRRAFEHGYSEDQVARVHGRPGGGQWRHPGPLLRGNWALERLGVEVASVPPDDRRRLLLLARLEYGSRMAGSAWAAARLRRSAASGAGS